MTLKDSTWEIFEEFIFNLYSKLLFFLQILMLFADFRRFLFGPRYEKPFCPLLPFGEVESNANVHFLAIAHLMNG